MNIVFVPAFDAALVVREKESEFRGLKSFKPRLGCCKGRIHGNGIGGAAHGDEVAFCMAEFAELIQLGVQLIVVWKTL